MGGTNCARQRYCTGPVPIPEGKEPTVYFRLRINVGQSLRRVYFMRCTSAPDNSSPRINSEAPLSKQSWTLSRRMRSFNSHARTGCVSAMGFQNAKWYRFNSHVRTDCIKCFRGSCGKQGFQFSCAHRLHLDISSRDICCMMVSILLCAQIASHVR